MRDCRRPGGAVRPPPRRPVRPSRRDRQVRGAARVDPRLPGPGGRLRRRIPGATGLGSQVGGHPPGPVRPHHSHPLRLLAVGRAGAGRGQAGGRAAGRFRGRAAVPPDRHRGIGRPGVGHRRRDVVAGVPCLASTSAASSWVPSVSLPGPASWLRRKPRLFRPAGPVAGLRPADGASPHCRPPGPVATPRPGGCALPKLGALWSVRRRGLRLCPWAVRSRSGRSCRIRGCGRGASAPCGWCPGNGR